MSVSATTHTLNLDDVRVSVIRIGEEESIASGCCLRVEVHFEDDWVGVARLDERDTKQCFFMMANEYLFGWFRRNVVTVVIVTLAILAFAAAVAVGADNYFNEMLSVPSDAREHKNTSVFCGLVETSRGNDDKRFTNED